MTTSRSRARRLALTGAAFAAIALAPATAHAVTWTPVPTGTTAEITSIEYQSASRFWFTTATGAIFTRQADGSFARTRNPSGTRLNDVEFQPGGSIGFAVGSGGTVLRSADAGASWTAVNGISGNKPGDNTSDCVSNYPLADVFHVHFAPDGSAAWLFGQGGQLERTNSPALGTTAAGWSNANRNTAANPATCRIASAYNGSMYDGVVAGPDALYVTSSYASIWFSAASTGVGPFAAKTGEAALGDARVMVGDPDSSRLWTVAPNAYGLNSTSYSADGAATDEQRWAIGNPAARVFPTNGPRDVDYAGGTVLSAGDAGLILASRDGATFSYVDAPGYPTTAWRAVSLASGDAGAVGGPDGTLLLTTDASALPAAAGNATTPPTTTPPSTQPPATTPPTTTPPPAALRTPTLAPSSAPPVTGKAAKVTRRFVVLRVRGKLGVPAGVDRSAACRGTVALTVSKGKRRLAAKTAKVSATCAYKRTIKLKRSKVGRAKRLELKVAFRGNDVLGKLSSSYAVRVKR